MVPGPAREMGIRFNDYFFTGHCAPDTTNSIVDVSDVSVGHAYFKLGQYFINSDNNSKKLATPPPPSVNSGVTAILPLGNVPIPNPKKSARRRDDNGAPDEGYGINTFVPAGWFALNGCGEMTGMHWVEESGFLQGPIMLTNTVSVGAVRNAVIDYWQSTQKKPDPDHGPLLPVVAETYDGWLNDILNPFDPDPTRRVDFGMAAKDAIGNALDNTSSNLLAQGNVGGGTGMTCYSWKGGIGTSSRKVQLDVSVPTSANAATNTFTVGVLVQANQGTWNELTILGAPVGPVERLTPTDPAPDNFSECYAKPTKQKRTISKKKRKSSIIVVIATDAPLLPHQLKRLARRGALGIARTGTCSRDDSGELCIAFSTANQHAFNHYDQTGNITNDIAMLPNDTISPCLFTATVEATEEAIINAMIAADDLPANGNTGCAITNATNPTTLKKIMHKYNRL